MHEHIVPHDECRCQGLAVRVMDTQYLALPEPFGFALQHQQKLTCVRHFAFLGSQTLVVETNEIFHVHRVLGMQTKRFLQLAAFGLTETLDHGIQITQILKAVGSPFACLEAQRTKCIHAQTARQIALLVIDQPHLVQLLGDLTTHFGCLPSVSGHLGRHPDTSDGSIRRHDDVLEP